MGVVADELPVNCVEPFLKYIKENNQGSSRLFQSFSGQKPVKQEGEENEPNSLEKKRPIPGLEESQAGNKSTGGQTKLAFGAAKKKPSQGLSANQSLLNFAIVGKKKK